MHPPIHPLAELSIIYLSYYLLSVCLSIHPSTYPVIYLPMYLSIFVSIFHLSHSLHRQGTYSPVTRMGV